MSEAMPFQTLRFDCPMCTRVQMARLRETRCASCGASLFVFSDAAAARRALESETGRSRDLRELGDGLYLVAVL